MYIERMKLRYRWGKDFKCVVVSDWISGDVPGLPSDLPHQARPRPAASVYPSQTIASIERARCATDARFNDARQSRHYVEFQRRRIVDKPDGFKQFTPSYQQPKRKAA